MEKRGNKENRKSGGRNMKITSVFKVKKCLFNSQTEFKSPLSNMDTKCSSESAFSHFGKQSCSPDVMASSDESPYSLFTQRKKRIERSLTTFDLNRGTPNRMDCDTPLKRNSNVVRKFQIETSLVRTESPENPVKMAVQKSIQQPDLIGDFSKPCLLPIIAGKHPDLKTISPNTVANLLQSNAFPNFTIIDCRYPYEFNGGHIKNAQNIYCKDDAEHQFFTLNKKNDQNIFIFYCEFSSERAPSMMRFLRGMDRDLNKDRYPVLYYPELYVIEGGYKAFYSNFKDLCEPQDYKPMLDKDCSEEMAYYRNQCKNNSSRNKRRCRTKLEAVSR